MLALTARTGRALLARARPRAGAALRAAKKSTTRINDDELRGRRRVRRSEPPQRLPLPAKTRKTVAFNQQYLCAGCGCLLAPEHEIDHIVPVALNGSDALSNLKLCASPVINRNARPKAYDPGLHQKRETTSRSRREGGEARSTVEAERPASAPPSSVYRTDPGRRRPRHGEDARLNATSGSLSGERRARVVGASLDLHQSSRQ